MSKAKAKADFQRVKKLISERSKKSVGEQWSLLAANTLPGWFVQKRSRGNSYDAWPASSRNPDVPQALPPCPHPDLNRSQLVYLLRREWVADADVWMVDQTGLLHDLARMIGIYAPTRAIADQFIDRKGFPRAQTIINPTRWNLEGHTEASAVIWSVNGATPNADLLDHITSAGIPVKTGSVKE